MSEITKASRKLVGDETRVIDLQGKLLLPGLIDSHAHVPSAVSELYEVWLYGMGSIEEYQGALKDFMVGNPDLQGVQGGGWINSVFGPNGPKATDLDAAVADIPAVLYSEDYHSVWVNSKTLELAGITQDTPDPQGGIIERDPEGNPSGTLRESAMNLVAEIIPPYTNDQLLEGLRYFQDMAYSYGMTTVYIPSASLSELKALHDFEASGEMTIRFPTAIVVRPEDDLAMVDRISNLREQEKGGNFWIPAVKIFIDGVLEGGTAYLDQPYLYDPNTSGELLWDPQHYNEMCAALDKAGFQIHVHSVGNAATRITLDGFAYARQQNGNV